ncbi:hypothetical protein [Actinocorallia sp. A-T 12471]|uniref:hypothetical protein n=1 Tax=Actinocorallia sp. A-T 12471 TaxID=3089813 RepID=UPI0029D03C3E|nr:hypothetical protein [Actinocorallia sp. A-T 12471]MDX6743894.1 hypothetical protein [Actinocorallia sp. A-T 12471]
MTVRVERSEVYPAPHARAGAVCRPPAPRGVGNAVRLSELLAGLPCLAVLLALLA